MATRNRIEIEIASQNNATRGLTQAATQMQALESAISRMATLFAGGAIVTGLTNMVTKYAALGEELGKLRTATGLSYQQLQALQQALREAGTAPEALNTATRILNVNIAQGDKTLAKYGITAKDTYGAILQVGQRLSGLGSSAQKSELAMAAFGRSSQDLIDTISKFATDENARKGLEAVGLSDAGVARLQKVDEAMDRLSRSWTKLSNTFAEMGAGPAAKALELVTAMLAYTTSVQPMNPWNPGTIMGSLKEHSRVVGVESSDARARAGYFPSGLSWSGGDGSFWADAIRGAGSAAGGDGGASGPSPWRPGSFFPGWNQYARRGITGGGSSGYNRLLAGSVSGMVPEPLNTFQSGKLAGLERTQAALRTFSAGVEASFSGMFSRVFGVTSRSNNIIVQLFADLANSVVNAVGQRIGSAIGNFAITAIGAAFGVPAAGAGASGSTVVINTMESKSIVDAMLTPSGSLRQANARMAQIAAVR